MLAESIDTVVRKLPRSSKQRSPQLPIRVTPLFGPRWPRNQPPANVSLQQRGSPTRILESRTLGGLTARKSLAAKRAKKSSLLRHPLGSLTQPFGTLGISFRLI